MRRQGWLRKLIGVTLVLTFIIPMLAACSNQDNTNDDEERVLRIGILYGGYDDSYFRQQFTDVYEMTHQNVRIDIVPAIDSSQMQYEYQSAGEEGFKEPDRLEALKTLMTGDNPVDIIVTDTSYFRTLARDGLLAQLDTKMQAENFDTSDFVPVVYEGLKEMGDGSLYGLTPTFSSSALVYNKNMFTEKGVPFPEDNMTWDEIFNLARQLNSGEGEDQKYGFSFERYQGNDLFYSMLSSYVTPLNLRIMDDKGEKMTVNTDAWAKVWETMKQLAAEKTVPSTSNEEMMMRAASGETGPFEHDLFLSGKVAMSITDFGYLNNDLYNAMRNASKIDNFTPFEWDVVTIPSHEQALGVSGTVGLYNIFAINSKAPNPEDAWDFVKFINSPEWAKIRSRSSYEMVSRKSYIKPKEGLDYNIAAFYNVKPVMPTSTDQSDIYTIVPNYWQIQDAGRMLFQEVMSNTKTVSEALTEWEKQGNELILQGKNNPDGTSTDVITEEVTE